MNQEETNPYESPREVSEPKMPKAPNTRPDAGHDKLVVLTTFDNALEAHQMVAELENHGVKARLGNEVSGDLLNMSIFGRTAAFWVEVLIHENDVKIGLMVKEEFENRTPPDIPKWKCKKCREKVDKGFAICWNCGNEYAGLDT